MKKAMLAALASSLLLSCGRDRTPPKPAGMGKPSDVVWCRVLPPGVAVPNQKAEEWALRRAIFLHLTQPGGTKRCFLRAQFTRPAAPLHFSNGSKIPDPAHAPVMEDVPIPEAFFEELRAAGRLVAGVSESSISRKGVKDRETGESGCAVLIVGDIVFKNATEAEVTGGWWRRPERAESYTYELKKIDGVWVVTGEHRTVVS